jgi:hypothetical protein
MGVVVVDDDETMTPPPPPPPGVAGSNTGDRGIVELNRGRTENPTVTVEPVVVTKAAKERYQHQHVEVVGDQ